MLNRPTGAHWLPHQAARGATDRDDRDGHGEAADAPTTDRAAGLLASRLSAINVPYRRSQPSHAARNGRPTHAVPHRGTRTHRLRRGTGSRPPARVAALRWGALTATLGTGAALRAVALYDTPEPTDREAALVTGVVTLSRTGAWIGSQLGALPVKLMSLATPQFAAITSGTGAWRRAPSALGAVRESGPLLWVLAGLLVWVLAGRVGAGWRWSVVAVALLALCPAAIGTARVAAPESLALLWSLAALVLATGIPRVGHAALRVDLAITGYLTVAILTAPVAIALLPSVLLLSARQGDPRRPALLTGAVLTAVGLGTAALASGLAVTTGPADWFGPSGTAEWFAPGWLGRDPVTPVVALVVALAALRSHRQRPLAVGVLGVAVLAPVLDVSAALAVPLAAVLAVAVARERLDRIRERGATTTASTRPSWLDRWRPRPSWLDRWRPRLPKLAPAGLTGLFALVWAANLAQLPKATTPPPTTWARAWLRDNVPNPGQVHTDPRSRVALISGTDAWPTVNSAADCQRPSPPATCADQDWWVTTPAEPTPPAAALIAEFGPADAPDRIEVRTTAPMGSDPARELDARRAAGAALATSPQLRADPEVTAELRAGRVDPAAMSALGALLSIQRLRLVALPPIPGEAADRPLRQLLLTPDGPPPDGVPAADAQRHIVAFFEAQLGPFRPYAVTVTPSGVLVRYPPLAPPDLLEAFLAR
ncbi:MAG: hypothetical protein QOF38_2085 [Pseudonocardiales bacterium]|nr:hypothetical protein [Pseudonocardiales bacterium]